MVTGYSIQGVGAYGYSILQSHVFLVQDEVCTDLQNKGVIIQK